MVMSVREAGAMGGRKVLQRYGPQFYSQIGRLGQEAMRRKYPGMAAEWGKLGGRPRRLNLNEMGQEGKPNKGG
jgi:hypothetical protein